MEQIEIRAWGNSQGIRIPKKVLEGEPVGREML